MATPDDAPDGPASPWSRPSADGATTPDPNAWLRPPQPAWLRDQPTPPQSTRPPGTPPPPFTAPPFNPPPSPEGKSRLPVRISPIFGGLVAAFVVTGFLCADEVANPRIWIFAFVILGWVISLCLHEFAHAATAYLGGDHSVEARGYLTLDPRRYVYTQTSIVLPIIIVAIGGIPLPGGAVLIDRRQIKDRRMQSLISAAGPLTNVLCALLCGLPLATGLVHHNLADVGLHSESFGAALAFLAFLEIIGAFFNALPIPGLDGFGIIAPFLPPQTVRAVMPMARMSLLIFIVLFLVLRDSPSANTAFFNFFDHVLAIFRVNGQLASDGQSLFLFYQKLS
jgi:Zn-dependent protease